jgi:hypothetical protein
MRSSAAAWRRPATAIVLVLLAAASLAQAQPPTQPVAPQSQAPVAMPPGPEDRVVVTGMVPVPNVGEGAPYYVTQEITRVQADTRLNNNRTKKDAEGCEASARFDDLSMKELLTEEIDYANDVLMTASRAVIATEAAERARTIPTEGEVDQQEVIRTELERQKAVNKYDDARLDLMNARAAVADYQELARGGAHVSRAQLMVRQSKRMKAGWGVNTLARTSSREAKLESVSSICQKKKDGDCGALVRGTIRNTSDKPIRIPKLTMTILDERGLYLTSLPADSGSKREIPPGQAIAFQYELDDLPEKGVGLFVGIASEIDPPPRLPMMMLEECDADRRETTGRVLSQDPER